MKCPDCGTEMKPLATSMYCPNDCDRKVREEIDPEKTPRIVFRTDRRNSYPGTVAASGSLFYQKPPTSTCPTGSVGPDQDDDNDLWAWVDKLTWDTD